jgi:hypothetical protein
MFVTWQFCATCHLSTYTYMRKNHMLVYNPLSDFYRGAKETLISSIIDSPSSSNSYTSTPPKPSK